MTERRCEPSQARNRSKLDRLCFEITEYLRNHPQASDTALGISGWWLTERQGEAGEGDVERALDRLVETGLVVRRVLGDGTHLYTGIEREDCA
jgi:hypothetical protein